MARRAKCGSTGSICLAVILMQAGCGCGGSKPGGEWDAPDGGDDEEAGDLEDLATDDGGGDLPHDPTDAPGDDTDTGDCAEPCGTACCAGGEVCREGECLVDHGPCAVDDECQDDTCCAGGACVPFGSEACGAVDEECTTLVIAGLFQPSVQCQWTGPPPGDPYPSHVQVLGTPVVADLDLDDDPTTVRPSIIFNSYDGLDGDSGVYTTLDGVLRIIDGRTCVQQFSIGPYTNGCNTPAVGDLDLDGRPEIVIYMNDSALEAYSFDPGAGAFTRAWESHDSGLARHAAARTHMWTGPSIADLDGDGSPEIIADGTVYGAGGLLRDATAAAQSYFSVVADLDRDGLVDLATGASVYEWTGGAWALTATGWERGYVAVADFGTYPDDGSGDSRIVLDGIAEVAVVHEGRAVIHTVGGRIVMGPVDLPASTGGGPPTIGDFDGDGLPELAAAASDSYTIFDLDCSGTPDPARCASLRTDLILWTMPSQDHSSNITGSSIFDFEGDGRAEAVYADECFVRVHDGTTGEVVFSQYRSSCTWNENPIVADVDGDLNAELVVPSNQNCATAPSTMGGTAYDVDGSGRTLDPLFAGLRCDTGAECMSGECDAGLCRCASDADCDTGDAIGGFVCATPPAGTPGLGDTCRAAWQGGLSGIRVYRDGLDRWVGSRTIWNQHAYAITHVMNDGTIPATGSWAQNWIVPGLNDFRQNVQGDVSAEHIPDMTAGYGAGFMCQPDGSALLTVLVCNRGTAPVGSGIPVTFYEGLATDCAVIPGCTSPTPATLDPGDCTAIACTWAEPPEDPVVVTVVADDDGTCTPTLGEHECHEGNNSTAIEDVACDSPI